MNESLPQLPCDCTATMVGSFIFGAVIGVVAAWFFGWSYRRAQMDLERRRMHRQIDAWRATVHPNDNEGHST